MIGLRLLPLVLLTEVAKLKRTLALGMAVLAPLVIVILYFMVALALFLLGPGVISMDANLFGRRR